MFRNWDTGKWVEQDPPVLKARGGPGILFRVGKLTRDLIPAASGRAGPAAAREIPARRRQNAGAYVKASLKVDIGGVFY